MQIEYLDISHLTNDAYHQFFSQLRYEVDERGAKNLRIEAPFRRLCQLCDDSINSLHRKRASDFTKIILNIDTSRDEAFLGIRGVWKYHLKHYLPEKRAAAKRLKLVFDQVGDISRRTYNDKSEGIRVFYSIIENDFLKEAKILGIDDWLAELLRLNILFDETERKRVSDYLTKPKANFREYRKAIDNTYYEIIKLINAYMLLGADEVCRSFVKILNVVIKKYERL